MENLRTLKKLLGELNMGNKEVTRYKGEYWLLHICQRNDIPVPLFHDKSADSVAEYMRHIAS